MATLTTVAKTLQWKTVCHLENIMPNSVCVLINGEQVAIFRIGKHNDLFAISNFDPFSQANVLSRGLTCDLKGTLCVASPIYKQHFNLETGQCLEDSRTCLKKCTPYAITAAI